jgi:hypothetical protein
MTLQGIVKQLVIFPKKIMMISHPRFSAVKQMGFPAVSSYFVGNFL